MNSWHCGEMRISLRAAASSLVLGGALCLTGTGTAQADSYNYSCELVQYNAANGTIFASCLGGPDNATSGTLTKNATQERYRCGHFDVSPIGPVIRLINGSQCTPQ
jgi:hypothetical protein